MRAIDFFEKIKSDGIEIDFEFRSDVAPARLSNEAMFHLPLIAMTILTFAKGHVKPPVDGIGQLVGDCYERSFPGFRGSAQHLGWSAALRVRTVQALSFLEQARLIEIESEAKKIGATSLGRSVIDRAISLGGDLASNLVLLERCHRNIRAERQLKLVAP